MTWTGINCQIQKFIINSIRSLNVLAKQAPEPGCQWFARNPSFWNASLWGADPLNGCLDPVYSVLPGTAEFNRFYQQHDTQNNAIQFAVLDAGPADPTLLAFANGSSAALIRMERDDGSCALLPEWANSTADITETFDMFNDTVAQAWRYGVAQITVCRP